MLMDANPRNETMAETTLFLTVFLFGEANPSVGCSERCEGISQEYRLGKLRTTLKLQRVLSTPYLRLCFWFKGIPQQILQILNYEVQGDPLGHKQGALKTNLKLA